MQGETGSGGMMPVMLGHRPEPAGNGRKVVSNRNAPVDRNQLGLDVELRAWPDIRGWRCLAYDIHVSQRTADRSCVEAQNRMGWMALGLGGHLLQA